MLEKEKKLMEDNLTGFASIDKPWKKYYTKEEMEMPIPRCTVYESIYENNQNHLEDIALLYFGKKISYKDMFLQATKAAKAFVALGVSAGDNVALCMPAIPETIYTILALNRIGVNACMLNPTFTKQQLKDRVDELETSVIVVMNELYHIVEDVIEESNIENVIVCPSTNSLNAIIRTLKYKTLPQKSISWEKFIKKGIKSELPALLSYKEMYPAVMVYSSGTTGASKGIQLTNDGINATLVEGKSVFPYIQRQDKYFIQVPIWFSTGISVTLLVSLYYGMIAMLEPIYDFNIFYKHISKYHPQYMVTATGLVDYLCSEKHYNKAYQSFKCLAIGGEYVTPFAEKRYNKWLNDNNNNIPLQKGYGMCELGGTATAAAENRSNVVGSAGIPTPHVLVSAFDINTGKELSYGMRGEIQVCSPCSMLGYYKRPSINEKFFRIDNEGRRWAHTGDMGYVDKNGNVYVSGRLNDSYQDEDNNIIFLFDIERTILSCEEVRQCKVVTVIDKEKTYRVAHIVAVNGEKNKSLINKIKNVCEKELPQCYRPHYIKIHTNGLPVALSGKLDTEKMRSDFENLVEVFI